MASVLSAAAWSTGSLIVFRVFQGFAGGMLLPTMLTVLSRAAGPGRQGATFGLSAVPLMFGPILGPILSGLILAHLSWRWLFLLNLPIGVAALALAIRFVPPMERAAGQEARPLDVTGLLLLSPGFAALVYALSQAANAGFGATRVVVALLAGAALLAGYTWHALTTGRPPLIDLRLFSRRGFAASV